MRSSNRLGAGGWEDGCEPGYSQPDSGSSVTMGGERKPGCRAASAASRTEVPERTACKEGIACSSSEALSLGPRWKLKRARPPSISRSEEHTSELQSLR